MQREFGPKNSSLIQAVLWMLWIIPSTVSGITVAWERTFSRSLSVHPEPFSAFRCKTMASFVPEVDRGDGFPNITEHRLFGVSGRSQTKLP